MATILQTPNVVQGSTAGWDVPLKADLIAVRDVADAAATPVTVALKVTAPTGTAKVPVVFPCVDVNMARPFLPAYCEGWWDAPTLSSPPVNMLIGTDKWIT